MAIQAQPLVPHHSGERKECFTLGPEDLSVLSSHHYYYYYYYYYHYFQLIIAVPYSLSPTAVKIQPFIATNPFSMDNKTTTATDSFGREATGEKEGRPKPQKEDPVLNDRHDASLVEP